MDLERTSERTALRMPVERHSTMPRRDRSLQALLRMWEYSGPKAVSLLWPTQLRTATGGCRLMMVLVAAWEPCVAGRCSYTARHAHRVAARAIYVSRQSREPFQRPTRLRRIDGTATLSCPVADRRKPGVVSEIREQIS